MSGRGQRVGVDWHHDMLDDVCHADNGGDANGAAYDDTSPNPSRWSAARVHRWLGEYQSGKFAALQHDWLFKGRDGADLCTLSATVLVQLCPGEEDQGRLKEYVFAMTHLQALASASNTGEPNCAPRSRCGAMGSRVGRHSLRLSLFAPHEQVAPSALGLQVLGKAPAGAV